MNAKIRFGIFALTACSFLILVLFVLPGATRWAQPVQAKPDNQEKSEGKFSPANPVVLTDNQGKYPLGLHLDILKDVSGKLTIEDVSSPAYNSKFIPSKVQVPNFGYTDSTYWVRFSADNQSRQTLNWLLEVGFANTQYVDFYSPSPTGDGFAGKHSGSLTPFNTRDVDYNHIVFKLQVPPNNIRTFYLRFQSGASMTIPLVLWLPDTFYQSIGKDQLFTGFFYGTLLIFLAYSLFVMYSLRDKSYFYFVAWLACSTLAFAAFDTVAAQYLWPNLPFLNRYAVPFFQIIGMMAVLLFVDSFLEFRARNPKLHLLFQCLAAGWVVPLLLLFFTTYRLAADVMVQYTIISYGICCIAAFISWRSAYQPARFFLFAWVIFLMGMIYQQSVRLGYIPPAPYTQMISQIGMLWCMVFWSISLTDRVNQLRTETEQANRNLQQSQNELTQIMDGVPLGIVVYGKDQTPKYVNKRAMEILSNPGRGIQAGLRARRTLQQAIEYFSFHVAGTNVKYPFDKMPIYTALRGQPASVNDLEADLIDRSVPIEMWASPITDQVGNVQSAVAAFQDITERKQVEAELEDHRKHLETLVEKRTEQLRLHLEWLEAVNLVNQMVVSSTDFSQVNEKIVEIAREVFKAQDAFIAELHAEGKQLRLLAHSCHDTGHLPLVGSCTNLPEELPPYINMDPSEVFIASREQVSSIGGPIGEHISRSGLQSIVIISLRGRDEILGFLGLELCEEGRIFTMEENHLLSIFSTDIAQVLINARRFEQSKALVAIEERNRIARDLHDSVAQAVYGITLYANAIRMARENNKLDVVFDHLEEVTKLSREALSDTRLLIFQLRPPILEEEGLQAALQSRLDTVEARAGVKVHFENRGKYQLTPEQEIELYWIAQEILNNALKHAQAGEINVQMKGENGCFQMILSDNGIGFDVETAEQAGGQGLRNIHERAEKIGARCTVTSAPGQGAKVTVELLS